jgi:hypothetical protein
MTGMVLRHEPDVSLASWYAERDESWVDLCSWGPAGYPAYAQVLHLEPELVDDEQERMDVEGDLTDDRLAALVEVLALHTSTPDDCFFGLWEGFGDIHGGEAVGIVSASAGGRPERHPRPAPAFPPEVVDGPRVRIPGRGYLLFRGPLAEAGQWGAADLLPGWPRRINSPNLMWPADHAWFVATEIDEWWTGVGGSAALVEDLRQAPGLDVRPR